MHASTSPATILDTLGLHRVLITVQPPTMSRSSSQTKLTSDGNRKRVLVVGAGAAGMACADGLAQHSDKFDVTLIGMARAVGND